MTFSFNPNIPNASNDPADDQPLMQTNFSSTSQLINVDHVGFNTSGGGQHNQVTFNSLNAQGSQVNPASVLFTQNNSSTNPQLVWKNSQDTFQINSVKAWGVITGTASAVTFGCSVAQNTTGVYTVTFTKSLPNNNYAVIATGCSSAGSANTQALVTSYNQLTGTFQLIIGSRTTSGGNFFTIDQFPVGFAVLSTGG